ncbi:hydrogenase expression/formation protein HypC [Propionispira arboris]|uniref:Hydrogenase expression/formation protein HypC n=1 Tax=Propionispira arboris TaxID=84035 RepID=A0A1H7D0R1_9FIRM|nr:MULTISPECIES: HypC/HybG/HupF family hydrogenase formation chaperone [Propionispira]SEJ95523.1 hydrogenase expression/formation protein HypC [Propionispira arboris]
MCLAVPAKIIDKKDQMAVVEVNSIQRQVSLMLLPEAGIGDFVLIHAGFAIQAIDEEEATLTNQLLREMNGSA